MPNNVDIDELFRDVRVQNHGGAPLLGNSIIGFVKRRMFQTALGGVRISGGDNPWYIISCQLLLFSLPGAIGGLATGLIESDTLSPFEGAVFSGIVLFVVHIYLRWFADRQSLKVDTLDGGLQERRAAISDDDGITFFGCCDPQTTVFVLPPASSVLEKIVNAIVLSVMQAIATLFLLPSRTIDALGDDLAVALCVLGWISVCIAVFGLTGNTPVEPSRFRELSNSPLNGHSLSRSVHVLILTSIEFAITGSAYACNQISTNVLLPVMVCMPIVWVFGIIPTVEGLFPWVAEQVLVYIMGGSAALSDSRLAKMLFISILNVVLIGLLGSYLQSEVAVIVGTVTGGLLSVQYKTIFNCGWQQTKKNRVSPGTVISQSVANPDVPYWNTSLLRILLFGFVVGILCYDDDNPPGEADLSSDSVTSLHIVAWVIWGVQLICTEFQKAYIMFGCLRNPAAQKWNHNGKVNQGGLARQLSVLYAIVHILGPLWTAAFVTVLHNNPNDVSEVLLSIALARALRWGFQNSAHAITETALVAFISEVAADNSSWHRLPVVLQLMLMAVARAKVMDFCQKLLFVAQAFASFASHKKLQIEHTKTLLIVSILCSPIILAVLSVTVALESPLLPLFGLPLFLIGFPRPQRFWPSPGKSACQNSDSVYYEVATRRIGKYLSTGLTFGAFGGCSPGDMFLLRYDESFVFVHMVEEGMDYGNVIIKGLELNATSCHTTEALKFDEMLEDSFEKSEKSCRNKHLDMIAVPIDTTSLELYSIARSSLVGVIDSPLMNKLILKYFPLSFTWIIRAKLSSGIPNDWIEVIQDQSTPMARGTHSYECPSAWYKKLTGEELPIDGWMQPNQGAGNVSKINSVEVLEKADIDDLLDTIEFEAVPGANRGQPPENRPSIKYRNGPNGPPDGKSTSQSKHNNGKDSVHLSGNRANKTVMRTLVNHCAYYVTGTATPSMMTPYSLVEAFQGLILSGRCNIPKTLQIATIKAFRYAVKLAIDDILMGEPLNSDLDTQELEENFSELDKIYIGVEGHPDWNHAVRNHVPLCMSLGVDPADRKSIRLLVATRKDVNVHVSKLNRAAVEGQWASLHLELLYLANDDEERYSIQAHEQLLRNLVVQTADPPLGYPIYNTIFTVPKLI